jgi:hypothetical protein
MMGAAVGAALVEHGHTVVWASAGRSQATTERARTAGMTDVGELERLLAETEVLLSIAPPHAALDIARSVAGYDGLFVDANAIAPQTAAKVPDLVGSQTVDGSIVGPPPHRAGSTRLFLSGTRAQEVADLFEGSRVQPVVLAEAGPTGASLVKMSYAAWTKASAALLLAAEATAAQGGVADALRDEWERSLPGLTQLLEKARADAVDKGWRWTGEMQEVSATFDAAGQPGGFGAAAAQLYDAYPRAES